MITISFWALIALLFFAALVGAASLFFVLTLLALRSKRIRK